MRFLWVSAIMPSGIPKTPTFASKGYATKDEEDTANNFGRPVKAGLGWSLEQCVQHYGKPDYTTPLTDALTDLPSYDFKTKGFEITAVIGSEGKVVGITYFSHDVSARH